jgi:hypothetical protein
MQTGDDFAIIEVNEALNSTSNKQSHVLGIQGKHFIGVGDSKNKEYKKQTKRLSPKPMPSLFSKLITK